MINTIAADFVYQATEAEMKAAIEEHGKFNSNHEAWSVMKEEIEEVNLESMSFKGHVENEMAFLWELVKSDDVSLETATDSLLMIQKYALEVAHECVQVAAMCGKWELCIAENEEEEKAPNKQLEQCFMHQFTEIDTEVK